MAVSIRIDSPDTVDIKNDKGRYKVLTFDDVVQIYRVDGQVFKTVMVNKEGEDFSNNISIV